MVTIICHEYNILDATNCSKGIVSERMQLSEFLDIGMSFECQEEEFFNSATRRKLSIFPSWFIDMELVCKMSAIFSTDLDSEENQEEWVVSANWEPQITGDDHVCLSVFLSVCLSDMAWLITRLG